MKITVSNHIGWVNVLQSTGLLEHLSSDGDGGVVRIGDDGNHSIGANLGGGENKFDSKSRFSFKPWQLQR